MVGEVPAHRGTQRQAPSRHTSPAGQTVPVPGQLWSGQLLGRGRPQATVVAEGQLRMHSQRRRAALQRWPEGHWVPTPQAGPPGQLLGMSCPHATVPGVVGGHEGMHSQRPIALQRSPGLQRVPTPGHDAPEQALRMP